MTTHVMIYEISDHLPTTCSINLTANRVNNPTYRRDMSNFNRENFLDDVNSLVLDLSNDLTSSHHDITTQLDMTYNSFISKFSEIVDAHAPIKPLSKRQKKQKIKPWLTKGIIKSIATKNKMYTKCYKQNKPELTSMYKKFLNKLTTVKRLAKEQYYTAQLIEHKQNISKQWAIINELLERNNKRHRTISKMVNKDNVTVTGSEICNTLNDYFVNIGPSLSEGIDSSNSLLKDNISSNVNSLFLQPIVPAKVYQEIHNLSIKKSAGPENVPIKFYSMANECISNLLCCLFNLCIENVFFPSTLKLAKVIPMYKSGKHCSPNNYRPISLLSPVSKVFEGLISKRLLGFLNENNIIADQQFGFRKKHATTHVVTDVYTQISNNLDVKKHTCIILLDLRKAFDTVNHSILLQKLEKYGIRGNVLQFFQSYLSKRLQFVFVNNYKSHEKEVKCGIPQGSNLGPILFSLYVNDIPAITKFSVRLFADDTVLIMSNSDLKELNKTANCELKKIEKWLSVNKLTLNYSKTSFMLFSPKSKCANDFSLSMRGKKINEVVEAKYLGIHVDEKLNWNVHIQNICKKISQYCGIFYNLSHCIHQNHLQLLYHALVYPHLLYGILTWGSTNDTIIHPLQVLQNRLIRIICHVKRNEHVTNNSLFQKLKILKIKDIYHLELAKFMYQYHNSKLPKVFDKYFTCANIVHKHDTKSASLSNYYLHSINTNSARRALSFSGAQVWNGLNLEWRDFSYHKFKKSVKNLLLSKYL